MKNKYLIIITVAVLAVSFILGVTKTVDLSAADTTQKNSKDKLIGIMVTKESLYLFDFESYFNDHANDILNGSNVISATDGYDRRIYAELVETAAVNEETGETVYSKEYRFPDTDGFYMYCATVYDEHGEYVTNIAGEGFSDVKSSNHYKDKGEERTMEATLYTTYGSDLYTVYVNPIYQTESGEVYLTEGTGIGGQDGLTKTLTESVTLEKDGEEYTYSAKIIIRREQVNTPKSIVLTQMNADNEEIKTEICDAGKLPETIVFPADTAYVLVTQVNTNELGNTVEERSLLQPSDNYLETFKVREDGVCEKLQTEIVWANNADFIL